MELVGPPGCLCLVVLMVRSPFSCPQILDVNQSHDATCLPSPSSDNDGHAECPSPTLPGQLTGECAREEWGGSVVALATSWWWGVDVCDILRLTGRARLASVLAVLEALPLAGLWRHLCRVL
jgi:hypothetical protein